MGIHGSEGNVPLRLSVLHCIVHHFVLLFLSAAGLYLTLIFSSLLVVVVVILFTIASPHFSPLPALVFIVVFLAQNATIRGSSSPGICSSSTPSSRLRLLLVEHASVLRLDIVLIITEISIFVKRLSLFLCVDPYVLFLFGPSSSSPVGVVFVRSRHTEPPLQLSASSFEIMDPGLPHIPLLLEPPVNGKLQNAARALKSLKECV
ncbi:hypothetical protein FA10DRAFT_158550 [Acaromyces ingoldii]|uniref:Uncharacterized protein n=1 Tax=Acaromyces ingoldii TaxID=215250 RepID=A0A316YGH0_9BASI|nr:hypothetical protein FA10DRAFT_158550 [Acaromyces ingoldii]PWN88262.1 hypothetical protein FA10DRAFT_158550 [Acaromyces ingoldii]